MSKNNITLNVYDDNDQVIKTVKAEFIKLRFGTIRKLMKLVQIESAKNTKELLLIVSDVWDDITRILSKAFPDMKEEDWDKVDTMELLGVVVKIVKLSAKKIDEVPTDESEKN